jgi:hypothetical protein
LPSSGDPNKLDKSYTNPIRTASGSFGGEVVALALNLQSDECDAAWSKSCVNMKDLHVCKKGNNDFECKDWDGKTIGEIFTIAQNQLGGCGQLYNNQQLCNLEEVIISTFKWKIM